MNGIPARPQLIPAGAPAIQGFFPLVQIVKFGYDGSNSICAAGHFFHCS